MVNLGLEPKFRDLPAIQKHVPLAGSIPQIGVGPRVSLSRVEASSALSAGKSSRAVTSAGYIRVRSVVRFVCFGYDAEGCGGRAWLGGKGRAAAAGKDGGEQQRSARQAGESNLGQA